MPKLISTPVNDENGPKLRDLARDKVERKVAFSDIFDQEAENRFPRFNITELKLGRVLGIGGFCTVSDVLCVSTNAKLRRWENNPAGESEEKERERICSDARNEQGGARYALKQLSDDCRLDVHQYVKGMVDLALEVKFLAVLDHPHIIKMRAVSKSDPFVNRGFFVVLDRLYDTLERRCFIWKRKKNGINALISKVGATRNRDDLLLDRLGVAHDLCSALLYMHQHSIIYRDLKPENIGFDVQDRVKIFDLGLARVVCPEDMLEDGTWNLTGMTGSLRYMAPEVVKSKPYNFSADVYSFGILLWQIISLKVPFEGLSVRTHDELVVSKGSRPPIKNSWPKSWGSLMFLCWHADLSRRPRLDDTARIIREQVNEIRCDSESTELNWKISVSEVTQDSFYSTGDDCDIGFRGQEDEVLDRTLIGP